jgi:hypothetical protein
MALTSFQVAHGTGWVDPAQARGLYIPTSTHAPVTLIKIEPLVPCRLVEIIVSVFQTIASYRIHTRLTNDMLTCAQSRPPRY